MNVIGQTIARLRKEQAMTQETLAESIGVSPQTISKWENSITCPDVMLLPVLADLFGVTVDALFARDNGRKCLHTEDALDAALEQIRQIIVGCFYHDEQRESFEQLVEDHRQALKSGDVRSVLENSNGGVIYMREPVGALLIKRPEDGWHSLFANEGNQRMLLLLTDADFRKAMTVILKKRMLTFTMPALCKMAGVEDGAHLEQCIRESGLFTCKTLAIDESLLTYFEMTGAEMKLYLLFATLTYAQEYADYKSQHCYFAGNMNYFTP